MTSDSLIGEPDFAREVYTPNTPEFPPTDPIGAFTVSSVNGVTGAVAFDGGVTGFGFSTAAPNVSLTVTNATTVRAALGIDTIATRKSNLGAGGDPTVGDDNTLGYAIGSLWTTATKAFIALSVGTGAAVWLQIG